MIAFRHGRRYETQFLTFHPEYREHDIYREPMARSRDSYPREGSRPTAAVQELSGGVVAVIVLVTVVITFGVAAASFILITLFRRHTALTVPDKS